MSTIREHALAVLVQIENEKTFSHLAIREKLNACVSSEADRALFTHIVYGTLQRKNTLEYILNVYLKKKPKNWIYILLQMSVFQWAYLDKIPEHALVNEAVKIAKKKGDLQISRLVNGVLRAVIRAGKEQFDFSNLPTLERLSLTYSHPEWLIKRWLKDFGEEKTEQICRANNSLPKQTIRVNRCQITRENLLDKLIKKGYIASASLFSEDGILIENGANLSESEEFNQGYFSIQDTSSMLVVESLNLEPGMRVLDCCAAPGGKAMHIAERMQGLGEVIANDVHLHKQAVISAQMKRLKLQNVFPVQSDARKLSEKYPKAYFDRILVDAPCSGFGVIQRKPEIKWTRREEDVQTIVKLQREILSEISPLLKPGGILVYSTCTIEVTENDGQIAWFLQENSQFKKSDVLSLGQIFPDQFHSDGFYIAALEKEN